MMAVLSIDGVVTRDPSFLRDAEALKSWLYDLARQIGMNPVSYADEPYSHWPNGAPSAVLFIEESAIVVHTYPEADYLELTLHSCKAIPDPEGVAVGIIATAGLDVRYQHYEPARSWKDRVRDGPYRHESWPTSVYITAEHVRHTAAHR